MNTQASSLKPQASSLESDCCVDHLHPHSGRADGSSTELGSEEREEVREEGERKVLETLRLVDLAGSERNFETQQMSSAQVCKP